MRAANCSSRSCAESPSSARRSRAPSELSAAGRVEGMAAMMGGGGGARLIREEVPGPSRSPVFEGSPAARPEASMVAMLTTAAHTPLADEPDGAVIRPGDARYDEA